MKLFKTSEVLTTNDYPYGSLRCTAHFSVEFKEGKGFRSVFQTINPKTGRLNNPKKGTYSMLMIPIQQDNGHYGFLSKKFYHGDKVNDICKFINENYDLFTPEQQEHFAISFMVYLKATAKAQVIYCGSKVDEVLKTIDPTVTLVAKGIKEKSNFWGNVNYPHNELEMLKVPDCNPFTVKEVA